MSVTLKSANEMIVRILILSFSILLINCDIRKNESPVIVNVKLTNDFDFKKFKKEIDPSYIHEDGFLKFFPIEIEIQNNTDSVFQFWEMSCSWTESWTFSEKKIHLYPQECSANIPVIKNIQPKSSVKYQ